MVTRARSVIIATALLESYSHCFYGNMHNKVHDGLFILSDSPNSIKGWDDEVRKINDSVKAMNRNWTNPVREKRPAPAATCKALVFLLVLKNSKEKQSSGVEIKIFLRHLPHKKNPNMSIKASASGSTGLVHFSYKKIPFW